MLALDEALAIVTAKEAWNVNDDRCDCFNQRTFAIFNPYHGVTEEIRLCCLFAELRAIYPQHFRTTVQEPAQWNGETDMPASIWHRQLAAELGTTVDSARRMGLEPPKGRPKAEPLSLWLREGGEWALMEYGS